MVDERRLSAPDHVSLVDRNRLSARRAILYGTLVVGTLDAIDAFVFFGLRAGSTPIRIFQSIASGWVGRAAYDGGLRTAALGAATHYFIAFGIVATYVALSRRIGALTRHPVPFGIAYGLLAYFVLNRIVIPLSAIGPVPWPPLPVLANGLLIHAFGIGLPAALFAAASRPPRSGD
jgi:hypothetical protein